MLGYAEGAIQCMDEALGLARALPHPFSLAYALIASAWLHLFRREGPPAQQKARISVPAWACCMAL